MAAVPAAHDDEPDRWAPLDFDPASGPPQWGPPGVWPAAPASRPAGGSERTGPLPLHPMSLGDILDGAFKLLKANARTIVAIVAGIELPFRLAGAFAARDAYDIGLAHLVDGSAIAGSSGGSTSGQALAQALVTLVGLLAAPFIAGAVSRVVAASYLGDTISVKGALRVALGRSGALLGAFVLCHVLMLAGFVLCIVPGVLLSALFTLVAPAIAIEEIGPVEAMRRSWRLVWPRLWPVLGTSMLAGLIASFVGTVIGAVPSTLAALVGGSWAWVVAGLGTTLGQLVAAPIVAIVATLLYFDARIRQEGFDLQVIAAHAGAR